MRSIHIAFSLFISSKVLQFSPSWKVIRVAILPEELEAIGYDCVLVTNLQFE